MNKLLIAAGITATLFVFMGCAPAPSTTTTPDTQEPEVSTEATPTPDTENLSPEDLQAYEAAIGENNEEECSSISDALLKEQCVTVVKENMEFEKQEEERLTQEEGERKQNDDLMVEIILSEDHTRCGELSLPNYVVDCEVNILSNQALQGENRSICDKASEEAREGCYFLYDNGQLTPAP